MNVIHEILNLPWPRIALLFLFFYLLMVIFAWIYADHILFPYPDPPTYEEKEVDFYVTTISGEKIACLKLFAKEPNGLTILYSHGNGEDLGMLKPLLEDFTKFGCNVIAYDYPGYGLSEGSPTEASCYAAIDTLYEYIVSEINIPKERLLLWGRSLGTGPSCYLASKVNIAGLILETPFLSAFRSVTEIPVLPWDRFRNINIVDEVKCPSLVIHGLYDEVVPFRQGRKIHKLLPEPKTFLEIKDASHNDLIEKGGRLYKETIQKFLKTLY